MLQLNLSQNLNTVLDCGNKELCTQRIPECAGTKVFTAFMGFQCDSHNNVTCVTPLFCFFIFRKVMAFEKSC